MVKLFQFLNGLKYKSQHTIMLYPMIHYSKRDMNTSVT